MGCEGCKQETIRTRTQMQIALDEAKKYTDEKKVQTVVYFDGQGFTFCEADAISAVGAINIVGAWFPSS